MSDTSKSIKRNSGQEPLPQYFSDANDQYETVKGESGAPKTMSDDGAHATIGAKADTAQTDSTKTTISVMGWLKGLVQILADVWNSTAHSLKVQVTGRNLTVGRLRQTYNTTITARAQSTILIIPQTGRIGRLLGFGAYVPGVVGSTGIHYINVTISGTASSYTTERFVTSSSAGTSDIIIKPSDVANTIKGLVFDNTNPLRVEYTAPETVDQSGIRMIYAIWEEEATI